MIFQGLLLILTSVSAAQNSYVVKQERFETEYYNTKLCDAQSGVSKYNRTTNAINVTFTIKVEINENDKCVVKGYKWLSNQYRLDIIQFEYTIKEIVNIKYFDIARLLVNYTSPPLTWPIQKNVEYKMRDWVPNSREFPPGIPAGKWKIGLTFLQANKTVYVTVNWYLSIEYKVKYYDQH